MSEPVGYRVDYRPGDPCYSSPEHYAVDRAAGFQGDVWGLFHEPQPGCSAEVEVYRGRYWVRPRHASAADAATFTPLYRGPQLERAPIDEEVALLFPSLVEPAAGQYGDASAAITKVTRSQP